MRWIALTLFLLITSSASSQQPCVGNRSINCFQNGTSPLGTNLSGDFSDAQPFLNLFATPVTQQWGVGSTGLNGTITDLSLDANGWPTSSLSWL